MSHPARGPVGTMGIDGTANAIGRRHTDASSHTSRTEAAA